MRRPWLAGVLACPFVASLAGCYWLASYQDLTSGLADARADGAPAFDASTDSPAIPEAAADSSSVSDGGSDGALEAAPFCPDGGGPFVYCMDFDGVDAASLGLFTYEAHAGIVDGISVSPPSSFFVHLDGPDVGTSGGYSVAFPFIPTSSRLEFQLRVGALSDSTVTSMGIALFDAASQTWRSLQLLVQPNGAYQIQEYIDAPSGGNGWGHTPYPSDGGGIAAGDWHHVVLTLDADDATQTYTSGLTVDGAVVEDHVPLQGPWTQGTANISVGSSYCRTGGSQIYYDNV
ncbi:MAG TPA: hypothetical protein VIY73_18725, partial [Polyangiaceae bacterium]